MPREPGPGGLDDLGRLYDRLGPSLYRYALMILADPSEAEDVVQRVFTVLVRRGAVGMESADAYLRRSVRNESYSALRRHRRQAAVADATLLQAVEAPDERPDDRLAIEQALRSLPAEQREVIYLKVFEGHTFQEIADLAGEPMNTIASRYRYAIDKLRTALAVKDGR